jgi:hypothetical protein
MLWFLVLRRSCDKPLEQSAKLAKMFARGRMNDDGLTFARRLNFSHTESHSLQSPPDPRRAEVDVESVTFDFGHFCQTGEPR